MERRVANLPTAKNLFAGRNALPPYMAPEHQHTNSSGSQDSILTQIPLPYHMAEGQYAHGGNYYAPAPAMQSNEPFATPDIPSHATFESYGQARSTPLNPNSPPYVPPGSGYPPAFDPNYNAGGSFGQSLQPPPGAHMGSEQQYPGANNYGQGDTSMSDSVVGGQGAQFQPPYGAQMGQGPYGHFSDHGMNEYQPYGMASQVPPPTTYVQASTTISPAMSYTSGSTQGWQTMSFGRPQGNTGRGSTSYGQHQGASGMQGQGWAHQYGGHNQYGVPAPVQPYVHPSNANRGKTAGKTAGKPVVKLPTNDSRKNNNRPSSNFAGGAGAFMNNQKQRGGQNKFGGPVLPPSKVTGSPTKSKASTHESWHEIQSQTTSQAALQAASKAASQAASQDTSEDDVKSFSDAGSPTPAAKVRKESDFQSENRNAQTPTLRTRRGQTVNFGSATDPARKTADWINKLPTMTGPDGENTRAPPPRMMNLLTNAIGGQEISRLRPINEADPFTGAPRSGSRGNAPLLNSSFAPHQLTTAYSAPLALGPPGMSPPLRMLTDNGKIMPSVDVALDTENLPFVEYCRTAKVDEWGVIKISNVSRSTSPARVSWADNH